LFVFFFFFIFFFNKIFSIFFNFLLKILHFFTLKIIFFNNLKLKSLLHKVKRHLSLSTDFEPDFYIHSQWYRLSWLLAAHNGIWEDLTFIFTQWCSMFFWLCISVKREAISQEDNTKCVGGRREVINEIVCGWWSSPAKGVGGF